MKFLFLAVGIALLTGCANTKTVVAARGKGTRQTFAADYQKVWKAAITACRSGEMEVTSADTTNGLITAKTRFRMESYGERIAVWVTPVATNRTDVEVISRKVGPAVMFHYNWEKPILHRIAAELPLQ